MKTTTPIYALSVCSSISRMNERLRERCIGGSFFVGIVVGLVVFVFADNA